MNGCPKCQSRRVATGHLHNDVFAFDGVFRPDGLRSFTFTLEGGIRPESGKFHACLDCGLLWNQVPAAELKQFVDKHCTDEAKANWGLAPE